MLNSLIGNWRTTAIGLIAAAFQLHMGGLTWQNAFSAALLGLLGFVAKDSAVGSKAVAK